VASIKLRKRSRQESTFQCRTGIYFTDKDDDIIIGESGKESEEEAVP